MSDKILKYGHLIEIDGDKRMLFIYRVYPDKSEKQLYTSVQLPQKTVDEDREGFEVFARILGENILIDSPQACDALGI